MSLGVILLICSLSRIITGAFARANDLPALRFLATLAMSGNRFYFIE